MTKEYMVVTVGEAFPRPNERSKLMTFKEADQLCKKLLENGNASQAHVAKVVKSYHRRFTAVDMTNCSQEAMPDA